MKRDAVLGVGAVGSLIAARMAQAGCEMLLCARGDAAHALQAVGLLLEKPDGRTVALAPDRWAVIDTGEGEVPSEWLGWADFAILCGKSYQTQELCRIAEQVWQSMVWHYHFPMALVIWSG